MRILIIIYRRIIMNKEKVREEIISLRKGANVAYVEIGRAHV